MELHVITNPHQEKVLRTRCVPFDFAAYDKKTIRALVTEMRKKMHEWRGVGLAATQIGRTESFFVAQPPNGKFYALFNPVITKTEDPLMMDEGCLSVPGHYGEIKRFDKVVLEAQDQNGKPVKIKAQGLLAEIFQHETDHLQGILYIDKVKKVIPLSERT